MKNNKSLENLIPFNELTESERRSLAKKAGKKSGEVRSERAKFKRVLNDILQQKASPNLKKVLEEAGVKEAKNLNVLEGLINLAITKSYDEKTTLAQLTRFLEFIRNTTDGTPIQMQINNAQNLENIEISKETIDIVVGKIKEL